MEQEGPCCPVCTLYLREGITLQAHLETHPKDQVIEALLKITNPNQNPTVIQASQLAEEPVHGQSGATSCATLNPGIGTQSSSLGNSQTQVTAGIPYQQFVTPNASTVIPQYIQVVAPNSSPSIVPNQTITFMPHPHSSPYVHSMYNPLYNPYIPQPYPLVQPVYTNMPFSSDMNSLMSTSQVTTPTVAPSTSQNAAAAVGRSDPTAEQETQFKRKSKELRLKRSMTARMRARLRAGLVPRSHNRVKKKKHMRARRSASSSASTTRSHRGIGIQSGTNTEANTSVIAKAKSLRLKNKPISPKPTASTSASVITQLPVTPGAPLRSRTSSESSSSPGESPHPAATVSFVTQAVPEIEETCAEQEDSSDQKHDVMGQFNRNTANINEYSVSCEPAAASCSVITDRNAALQLTGDMYAASRNIYENISESGSPSEHAFPQLPYHVEEGTLVHDRQPEMSENTCENFERELYVNEQDRLSEYNEEEQETQEKMYHSYEVEHEKKAEFTYELENQDANEEESVNRGEILDESNVYVAVGEMPLVPEGEEQVNDMVYIAEAAPESEEQVNEMVYIAEAAPEVEEQENEMVYFAEAAPESEVQESETIYIAEAAPEENLEEMEDADDNTSRGVQKVSSVIFLGNGSGSNLVTPTTERAPEVGEARNYSELNAIICTDLEPSTNPNAGGDLEMSPSINVNNYVEVDGMKIFFNTENVQTTPMEPVTFQNMEQDMPQCQSHEKPENERETLAESVIHLVSGAPNPKGEFSGETFQSSTSENNTEVRDLSPLSLNIRADESMPSRGELSEQESLGGENSTWALFHSEVRTKSERDLMSGNEFRATILDEEDCDLPGKSVESSFWREGLPNSKSDNVNENVPLDKDKASTPLKSKKFSCSYCKEEFNSLKAKKNHIMKNHSRKSRKINSEKGANENEINSLRNLTDSASESAIDDPSGENLENDELGSESESSSKKDKSSCEVTKLCPRCNAPFVGLKKLKEHLKEVHGESKYKCGTCSEIFDTEKEYNAHLRIHPLKCNQCGKLFKRKPNLKLHLKRHLTVKPYSCNQCPKSFVTRQKLDEHLNGHTGNKPLKCTDCDKTFSRHSNLIQHRNLHHIWGKKKEKDFVCRCGEVFHSARKLAWHKEVHDPKPKTCPFCSQKFIHSNSVTRHIRRSHVPHYLPTNKKDTDNVQCPVCGKIYLRSSLAVHMRVHNGVKPFVCQICSKKFTTKWNLELHNWTHQSRSSMPFKCSTCKSAFYREVDYVAHMNSHKNFRPFTCNICGQKFIRKYNCLRHQEEHKREKKFMCSVPGCEKSFHRNYYLRDHMKVHSGVRPHTCHICGKASSTKSNHNKHIRIHDTREPLNTEN